MSGEMLAPSQNSNARRRPPRPMDLKKRDKLMLHSNQLQNQYQAGDDYRHGAKSEPNMQSHMLASAPPLPPRTYKMRQGSLSVHEQLLQLCTGKMTSLHRAQSEELLSCNEYAGGKDSPYSMDGVHSARPIMSGSCRTPPEWSTVLEAAAKIITQSPEVSTCQLRLQAALQRVKALEDKIDRLTTDLERERKARQDLEAEVSGLREDRDRLQEERRAAENELKNFTDWVFKVGGASENELNDRGAL